VKQGADTSALSNSGCIPLNYIVNSVNERNLLSLIGVLTILTPTPECLHNLNTRGMESCFAPYTIEWMNVLIRHVS